MKMKLKTPITQLENSEDGFTSRRSQAEDRILVLKDKEDLDQISNKHKKNTGKEPTGNMGYHGKPTL